MACWQELCEMVLAGRLSPTEIMDRLKVKPSRLRRLLASKRLATRLEMHQKIADQTRTHRAMKDVELAAGRLSDLTESEKPETARRACRDVMAESRNIADAIIKRQHADLQKFWMKQSGSIIR